MYEALLYKKCKYGKAYELPLVGVIALLDKDIDILAEHIAKCSLYLKSLDGMNWVSVAQRHLIASVLTVYRFASDRSLRIAVLLTITNALNNI